MNPVLGFGFIVLGLTASVLGAVGGAWALLSGRQEMLRTIRQWTWLVVGAAVGAFVVMELALFQRDYTVGYVSKVGSPHTPALFNFAALWSSLEGSILLWTLVLAMYLAAMVVKFAKRADDPLFGWALVVMLTVTAFFFALMTGPANPFVAVEVPIGFEGPGPNPLLQNHLLMAFHPPMLYLGYVGFTVPFSFAIAALICGRMGEGWLVATRRWTVAAWGFLSFGIILGAWWSYEVLGWGGYWAWDPVENASLLPWLTGTAYIHSVMVQERRGLLRVWNLSLLSATFALTILGTFLTRSGVIESVHAFADGAVGPWLLVFFAVVVTVSIALIVWRADELASPGALGSPVSREASFLANNLLFGAMAFVVLLGTVFPLLAEAYDGTRLTIGRPYFDSLAGPLGLTLLFLMAVAPIMPWGRASTEVLSKRLFVPAIAGVAVMALALVIGARGVSSVLGFGLAGFAGSSALRQLVLSVRRHRLWGLTGRTNGGMVVHLGLIVLAAGLVAAEGYRSDQSFTLELGQSVMVEGRTLTYLEAGIEETERTVRTFAAIEIDGTSIYHPSATAFRASGQVVPTPSVKSTITSDLYLVLLQVPDRDSDTIQLRAVVRPLVSWLWGGGVIMALGTMLAVIPSRRKRHKQKDDQQASIDPAPDPDPDPEPDPEPDAGAEAEPTVEPADG